ncbi:MAG: hemerythrin domain-containing protein [Muribaculaceae bacterium]|nr:hemerythrin domain-containing protein [Muribaculaceae bacterium]
MASLIAENYQLLQVMSRFGIPLGFGDDSVEKTCCDNGVDCSTFLAVVNFISEGYSDSDTLPSLSVEALLDYLRQSHIYFLEYFLPAIRKKLLEGIRLRNDDVSFLILKFFDDYVGEVRIHMDYEEKNVFPYVKSLLSGNKISDFRVNTYSKHHDRVGSKLKELKKLIIKYCPESKDINILNDALYDIYRCEDEHESHCLGEDCLLVPAILQLENKLP